MIETAGVINDRMPEYCVNRCNELLNRNEKSVNGAKILALGAAYKQNINDYRESPAVVVMELLRGRGADVSYFDPWVPNYRFNGNEYRSLERLDEAILSRADLVLVLTAHTNVDYEFVQRHARLIFDTKNVMKNVSNRDNIRVL